MARLRKLRGLDQKSLAGLAGVTGSYVSHIESCRKTTVSPATFVRLCDALGVAESDRSALMAEDGAA